ncbi:hypothetical protein HJ588_04975 [Flexivirga sp. ID2601S]|uniref:Glycosyltransferase RgtA/B/C/D-like domain-containing protein n=1 Tax=Flexivirga aerilata TaxID=1656889 RepID=A0A849ADV7_9MICO|nr:hypothetical protein [Flexivirga aerilata]NNG38629.1 hypothetical protein [Flexivirga aerilata]
MAAVLCVPLLIWLVAWVSRGWLPQGDEGVIALKAQAVWSAHPPVQGMRSTSAASVPGVYAHHPGPIEFYGLSLPYAMTGWRPVGLLIGAAAWAAAMIVVAVAQAAAIAGRAGLWLVAAAVVVTEFAVGGSLVLPWNPWPPVLGMIALLVLAWRLLVGHPGVLPGFAAIASVVIQANLALVPVLAPLLLVLAGLGLRRWHRARGTVWPVPGSRPAPRAAWWRRPGVIAMAVLAAAWAPALAELWLISPSNPVELARLAAGTVDSPARVVGVVAAVGACAWVGWHLGDQPVGARTGLRWVTAVFVAGVVAALAAGGLARAVYLIMTTGGIAFVLTALGQQVVLMSRRRVRPAPRGAGDIGTAAQPAGGSGKVRVVAGILAVAAVTVVAAVGALTGPGAVAANPFTRLDDYAVHRATPVVNDTVAALRARGITRGPVVIRWTDGWSYGSFQTAVAARLAADGYTPFYDSPWPYAEDDAYRRIRHAPAGAPTVTLRDGPVTVTP